MNPPDLALALHLLVDSAGNSPPNRVEIVVNAVAALASAGAATVAACALVEAQKANRLTRQALALDRRPWLEVKGFDPYIRPMAGNEETLVGANLLCTNHGPSPAIRVACHIEGQVCALGGPSSQQIVDDRRAIWKASHRAGQVWPTVIFPSAQEWVYRGGFSVPTASFAELGNAPGGSVIGLLITGAITYQMAGLDEVFLTPFAWTAMRRVEGHLLSIESGMLPIGPNGVELIPIASPALE